MTPLLIVILKAVGWIAGAIATLLALGWGFEHWGEARQAKRHPAPGRMVDLGGRRLHLLCKGAATGPPIIIEQGAGGSSPYWWNVQDAIAGFARVCSYDRAGTGWSDAASGPRSMPDRVEDLRRLLEASGLPAPYVLVGHSYGGPLISLFARAHPDLVAGLVFADTPDMENMRGPGYAVVTRKVHIPMMRVMVFATRFGLLRLLPRRISGGLLPPGLPADARAALAATRRTSAMLAGLDDIRSIWTLPSGLNEPLAPGALGDKPVGVITHNELFPGFFARLEVGFPESQARLAALSDNSLSVIADSGHMVQLDAPETVVDVIRRVHAAARDGTRLPDPQSLNLDMPQSLIA